MSSESPEKTDIKQTDVKESKSEDAKATVRGIVNLFLIDKRASVTGVWPPRVRRMLKEKEGFLVFREKNAKVYSVMKEYPALKDIKEGQWVFQNKIPNTVVKAYLEKGWLITQEPKYKYGCGYPSDAYDICDCYDCGAGYEESKRKVGFRITIKKV